ncbi:hypothetical protein IG631_22645 [Alternaria alternata]|nr:hypothetical protein IG631_22645 [Alternaria alternata]
MSNLHHRSQPNHTRVSGQARRETLVAAGKWLQHRLGITDETVLLSSSTQSI